MSILNTQEQQIAQEIIAAGYQNAAQSFSGIAQQQVSIRTSTLKVTDEHQLLKLDKSGKLTLVTTRIMGETSGKSYFLLNEEECEAIFTTCLSPGNKDESRRMMEEAIIKEIDNIISAAVITEFSNRLQVSIFGDVPALYDGPDHSILKLIQADFTNTSGQDYYLFTNTYFVFENDTTLQPQFFWRLPLDFLLRIKAYSRLKPAV